MVRQGGCAPSDHKPAIGECVAVIEYVCATTEVEEGIFSNATKNELSQHGFSTVGSVWVKPLIQCDGEPCGYDNILVTRRIGSVPQIAKNWDEACHLNFMEYLAFPGRAVGCSGWGAGFINNPIRNNGGTLPIAALEAADVDRKHEVAPR
jgi:hypothetical protein